MAAWEVWAGPFYFAVVVVVVVLVVEDTIWVQGLRFFCPGGSLS